MADLLGIKQGITMTHTVDNQALIKLSVVGFVSALLITIIGHALAKSRQ